MVNYSPPDIPRCSPILSPFRVARVCLTLESPAMSTSVCRNLFLLQDNELSYCEQGQHRVQTGLEGLKEMAVIEEIATRMVSSASFSNHAEPSSNP